MNILEHTTNWYKGEIFEATIIGVVGLIVLAVSLLFWKTGKTPNAQAMFIPLLAVGLLLAAAGGFMASSNSSTLQSIIASPPDDQHTFVLSEQKRVEDFQSLYLYTKLGAACCFAAAIALFLFSDNRQLQAVAIALILIGMTGLTIDYFSKERADVYYNEIVKEMNTY